MLNVIILIGRLTKDPELRKTNSGNMVTSFSIAVDSPMKNADGSRGTTFIECSLFGAQAENVVKYTKKGSQVAIQGQLSQREYLAIDGSKRKVHEVIVDVVKFLDKKDTPAKTSESVLDDGALDSYGSLDGEKYEDEKGEEKELKFDPYTGKPLKPAKGK